MVGYTLGHMHIMMEHWLSSFGHRDWVLDVWVTLENPILTTKLELIFMDFENGPASYLVEFLKIKLVVSTFI